MSYKEIFFNAFKSLLSVENETFEDTEKIFLPLFEIDFSKVVNHENLLELYLKLLSELEPRDSVTWVFDTLLNNSSPILDLKLYISSEEYYKILLKYTSTYKENDGSIALLLWYLSISDDFYVFLNLFKDASIDIKSKILKSIEYEINQLNSPQFDEEQYLKELKDLKNVLS